MRIIDELDEFSFLLVRFSHLVHFTWFNSKILLILVWEKESYCFWHFQSQTIHLLWKVQVTKSIWAMAISPKARTWQFGRNLILNPTGKQVCLTLGWSSVVFALCLLIAKIGYSYPYTLRWPIVTLRWPIVTLHTSPYIHLPHLSISWPLVK